MLSGVGTETGSSAPREGLAQPQESTQVVLGHVMAGLAFPSSVMVRARTRSAVAFFGFTDIVAPSVKAETASDRASGGLKTSCPAPSGGRAYCAAQYNRKSPENNAVLQPNLLEMRKNRRGLR